MPSDRIYPWPDKSMPTRPERYTRSHQLFEAAQDLVAGGISSQLRRQERPVPLFFDRAKDGRMWDVDGNEYVDFVQGMGPNLFGHSPGFVTDAVAKAIRRGVVYTGQFERELEVAEMVRRAVPLKGPVRFASSGTEILQLVIRLARGYTGRAKFVKFEGHYHGWADSVSYSYHPPLAVAGSESAPTPVADSVGMDPATSENIVVCPWNDTAALSRAFADNPGQIAGVVMEPFLLNTNFAPPREGYLEAAQRVCVREGALLIFDEVITGFRVALGGAQELTGITPDLATYAKAMAGGFPIAMLVGRPDVMAVLGDGTVNHGGSFNSNVASIEAAHASLSHIMEDSDRFYADLNRRGQALMEGLKVAAARTGANLRVAGFGSVFSTAFTDRAQIFNYRDHARHCDEDKYQRFRSALLDRGVRIAPNGRWHLASTHTDADIEQTLAAVEESLRAL
ncbi:MAG: aspartate aminotransferase family protein [Chloroflexi bacterium]|nr:aspartate aminotransferase family protein [Chloroflexota bacterium]